MKTSIICTHSQPIAGRHPPEFRGEAGMAPRPRRSPFTRLALLVPTVWACLGCLNFTGRAQSGTQQSPMDITGANTVYCDWLPAIQPSYPASATLSMVLGDSGHGANINVSVAGSAPQLVIGSDTYGLRDFHFHYHAEHLTNGHQAAMEMHLVHTNLADGTFLVLGRFIETGNADVAAMGPIFNSLPSTPNVPVPVNGFNPTVLLPKTLGSFRYYGSLTTGSSEPFAEPVKWVVLNEPMYLSATQIGNFKNIIHENFREAQPLNGRTVLTDVPGFGSNPPVTVPAAGALPWARVVSDLSNVADSGGIALTHTLDAADKAAADRAGWHFTVVSRMVQGSNGNGPAQFMVYGNGTRRFVVAWDLTPSGQLTAALYNTPGTSTTYTLPASGSAATAYHHHELWYNPTTQQASYYFDGGVIAIWSGSSPDTNQDGIIQWGGISSLGEGIMNYLRVQFAINGEGPQAEFFGGYLGVDDLDDWSFSGTPPDGVTTGFRSDSLPEPGFVGSYASATDVPLKVAAYTATGKTATFDLLPNYAPAAGTGLTVIQSTGAGPVNGTFANLPQGQPVVMTNNTGTYQFVANYVGGDGNDLVLAWLSPYAWGLNTSGQLGNGTTGKGAAGNSVPAPVTATVLGNRTIMALDAGTGHSLALLSDGTVAAWGLGDSGQLGNGSFASSPVPVLVTNLPAGNPVVAIAAGSYFSLALCKDGTVYAWGDNSMGQLGNGQGPTRPTPLPRSATPVQVAGPLAEKQVLAIAAGARFGLAVTEAHGTDATLYAWGDNVYGQLGNSTSGSTAGSDSPVVVVTSPGPLAGKTVIDIDAGFFHAVALASDGTVAAWGLNEVGQLGATTASETNSVPLALTSLGDLASRTVVAVKCGAYHSLALCSDGKAAAWGWGQYGQLGISPAVQATFTPTLVAAAKPFKALAAGFAHSVGLYADGALATWGWNNFGQLGNGNPNPDPDAYVSTPQIVSTLNQPNAAIGAGDFFGLATSATVATTITPLPSHNLRISVESEGGFGGPRQRSPASPQHRVRLTVQSQANRPHAIQYKDSLSEPAWQHLHRANTDAEGILEHVHTQPDGTSQRFYRSLQE